jgi:hypothetical protein
MRKIIILKSDLEIFRQLQREWKPPVYAQINHHSELELIVTIDRLAGQPENSVDEFIYYLVKNISHIIPL